MSWSFRDTIKRISCQCAVCLRLQQLKEVSPLLSAFVDGYCVISMMTSDFASLSHSQSFELYTTPPKRQSPFACYVWWLLHRLWDQSLMVLSASDSPAFALLRTPAHRHNPRHLPVLHSYSLRAKILTCSTKSFIDTRPN